MQSPLSFSTLFKLRGLYLFTGLAGGSLNPYITTIFVDGGLAKSHIGMMMSLASLIVLGAQLFWGRLADRYQMTKSILLLSLAVPALLSILYQTPSILLMTAAYMTAIIFTAPQAPIGDAFAVSAAREAGSSYGSIRSFQSVGNALGGYGAGFFLSYYLPNQLWIPFLFISCLGILMVLVLPEQKEYHVKSTPFVSGMGELFHNKRFVLFLGACFLVNQTLTAFNTYFVVVFKMVGGSYALSGVALMIAAFSNVPSMFAASYVIRRLGNEKTMLLATLAYMVRWAIQYVFPIPSVMVAVQVLQGLSFGLFYVAAVEYVSRIVRKDMQATGQSIFNMIFVGLAGIVGNMLNGYLLEKLGPSSMNLVCTLSALLGAIMLSIVAYGFKVKEKNAQHEAELRKRYAAFDIGGTSVKYGVVRETGEVESSGTFATLDSPNSQHFMRRLVDKINELQAGNPPLSGVGISTAGIVDDAGLIVGGIENIPWLKGVNLKCELELLTKLETKITNDVNAAALGEAWLGAGKGEKSFFCIALGTGIGGALVLDAKLYKGAHFRAAEVGYMHMNLMHTNNYETRASTSALVVKAAAIQADQGMNVAVNGKVIWEGFKKDEPVWVQTVDLWMNEVAKGISDLIYVLDPGLIIVGGGVSAQKNVLTDLLAAKVSAYLTDDFKGLTRIVPALCGNEAGMLGAVSTFINPNPGEEGALKP
ncbi:ROK family protein [Paenibacillus sp. HWE-109]|uniref:ROK family protein n=1 Tax=Paenibacillus sp. HWE-109 TaxID=1306526 RepID=UPI001EE11EFD|nr:ROK family protein [Paenibacillus sp. HWE-109]UKS25091.1 ROK family protein [Paenibacillus sp. HWE-109]